MKILSLSTSSCNGGAARVAANIASAAAKYVDVTHITEDEITVRGRFRAITRRKLGRIPSLLERSQLEVYKSYGVFRSSLLPRLIDRVSPDIVHLHWVAGEFISIEDIGSLTKPIVWTMHDSWPFSGSEHHQLEQEGPGPASGYRELSRLNPCRMTFERKLRAYRDIDIYPVAPSQWMNEKASESVLFRNREICTIQNPVDIDFIAPFDRAAARQKLGIDTQLPVLMVGAMTSFKDPIKGIDLLRSALIVYRERYGNFALITVGGGYLDQDLDCEVVFSGRVKSREIMRALYQAANVTCVPSRIETHSQMAAESIVSGTPVVCFDVGGNSSVVKDSITGFLVKPFDIQEYAHSIHKASILYRYGINNEEARQHQSFWSPDEVGRRYTDLYRRIAG